MQLFWCRQTRAVRALWMVEELGKPYELVEVDIRSEEARPAELMAASPMGKVPALVDGEARLSESAAICLYLADRYAPGRLAPTLDDPVRAEFLYWMFFTPAVIEPALSEKFRNLEGDRFSSGWGDYDAMLSTLDGGLARGSWILGDRFTAADVMVGSSVVFMRQFGVLPDSQRFHSYADRCLERPAYARALARESD